MVATAQLLPAEHCRYGTADISSAISDYRQTRKTRCQRNYIGVVSLPKWKAMLTLLETADIVPRFTRSRSRHFDVMVGHRFWMLRSRWLAALFFFAILLRLGYFWAVHDGPLGNADSLAYEELAQKLLSHQPYSTTAHTGGGGFPGDLQRPPGYPAFLAGVNVLLGPSRTHTALVQCVLSATFAVVLAVLVAAFTTEETGLLAGLLYAVDWATIIHVPLTVADTLSAVLLGTAIGLFALSMVRRRGSLALAAGFFLGAAALVKPVGQVVVFAFLLGWVLQEKRRTTGLLFLLSYLVCVAPWMIRNYQHHGLATLSAIGTVDLYFYVAEASANPQSVTDFSGLNLNNEVTRISNDWSRRPMSPVERKRVMEQKALALIARHWPTVAYQSAVGFSRTCFGPGSITVANSMPKGPSRAAKVLLVVLPLLQVLTLWFLAVIGAIGFNSGNITRAVRVMLVACVILLVLPASASLGQSRYRVPAVPALAILGAIGGTTLIERRRCLLLHARSKPRA